MNANSFRALMAATPLMLGGCAAPALLPCESPAGPVAWIANYGWHTEIILAAAELTGPLAAFRAPGTAALSFGFGKLDFITVPSPGLGDFVRGAVPGPATIRVLNLHLPPVRSISSPLVRLTLTSSSLGALQTFLSDAIVRAPDGTPLSAAPPPDADTRFYVTTRGYSLAYTCNSWTADGLEQAGLHMGYAIVTAGGVTASVARIGASCAAN